MVSLVKPVGRHADADETRGGSALAARAVVQPCLDGCGALHGVVLHSYVCLNPLPGRYPLVRVTLSEAQARARLLPTRVTFVPDE